jgi:hypothetical protein
VNIEAAKGLKDAAAGPGFDFVPLTNGLTPGAGQCWKALYCAADGMITATPIAGTDRSITCKAGGYIYGFFTGVTTVDSGVWFGVL